MSKVTELQVIDLNVKQLQRLTEGRKVIFIRSGKHRFCILKYFRKGERALEVK